jgi:hypothetical protein
MPPNPSPTVNWPAPLCVVVVAVGALVEPLLVVVALIKYSLLQVTFDGGVALVERTTSEHYPSAVFKCNVIDNSQWCIRYTYWAGGQTYLEQIAIAAGILHCNRSFCTVGSIRVPNSADIHLNTDVLPVDLEEVSHRGLCGAGGGQGKVLDIRWVVNKCDHDEDCWRVPWRAQRQLACTMLVENARTIRLLMLARELDEGVPERERCSRRIDDVKATYVGIRSDEAIWPVGSTHHMED